MWFMISKIIKNLASQCYLILNVPQNRHWTFETCKVLETYENKFYKQENYFCLTQEYKVLIHCQKQPPEITLKKVFL